MEKIEFELLGLHLQEPMALLTNWLMCAFSIFAYFKLSDGLLEDVKQWKKFFFWFTISTFFGGLGHLFFQYAGIPGKFPNWISATIATYYAGKAILERKSDEKTKKNGEKLLLIKSSVLLLLSVIRYKFVFIAIDAILTYVICCGIMAYNLYQRGSKEMRYMVYGVLICLPSVFIFFLNLNPHRWLNKDDLSHLLMLACIFCFYLGANERNETEVLQSVTA